MFSSYSRSVQIQLNGGVGGLSLVHSGDTDTDLTVCICHKIKFCSLYMENKTKDKRPFACWRLFWNLTDVPQLYLHWAHTVYNSFICARVLDHVCGFEDERICGFSQDRSDDFDWTRQNHLTQNPKRSANTGPETDRSGTKEGENRTQ